ncbi:MAG: ATP-dependent DNA ligase [Nitrososphaeraceae archaeon]
MEFSIIANIFEEMQKTRSRLILTDFLVKLIKKTPKDTIRRIIYLLQGKIYPDYEGIELGLAEKLTIRSIAQSTGNSIEKIEKIYFEIGDLGKTTEQVIEKKYQTTLMTEKITVERVYDTFKKIANSTGSGSQLTKLRLVSSLLNDADPKEGKYIVKFLTGTLRLGIAENTIIDALSLAFTGNKGNKNKIENAYNIHSDLGNVGEILSKKGLLELEKLKLTPLNPVRPMLAERISSPEEALERVVNNKIACEYKLDGERVQIHKDNHKIELFSRSLEKISSYYPDIIDLISKFKINKMIVEGEIIPIDLETKKILPFQELMYRRRKYNIDEIVKIKPVKIILFEILFLEGDDCTKIPYVERRKILEKLFHDNKNKESNIEIVKQKILTDKKQIKKFLMESIKKSSEGLMLKQLDGTYRAGAREFLWMKLKQEYDKKVNDTLDLTIVGALFGKGKRTGYYGALLLAAYDNETNMYHSTCKVGTGFSDSNLENIFNKLKNFITKKKQDNIETNMKMDVWFEPKIVIEIIASEITLSPSHTAGHNAIKKGSGLALRFPKFTGKIREDKSPENSTTCNELISMYKKQVKQV